MVGHAIALLQLTSQAHDEAQSIDGHAAPPEQSIAHAPVPQLIEPHDAAPAQSIWQLRASAQSMSSQALPFQHQNVQ